ncbi:MAG: hypothetical protein EBS64_09275, partial [Verrucomicrobia bacterium]|nr:hypothetical protein [Verrucomicrobiota bacterium]
GNPGKGGKPSAHGEYTPRPITDSSMDAIASRHGQRVDKLPLSLFNLSLDPGEAHDVSAEHPDIVERLSALAAPIRLALGDKLTGAPGTERRPAGFVPLK